MNKLFFCVLLAIISVVFSSQVTLVPESLSPLFYSRSYLGLNNAYAGDYFITNGYEDVNTKFLAIYKIDSDGVLRNVSRFTDIDQGGQYLNFFTNGKWFGSNTNVGIYLFKLGSDDQPTASRYWTKFNLGVAWVTMLSDDTLVVYVGTDFKFHVLAYDSPSDDWIETHAVDAGRIQVGNGIYHAVIDDNYFIAVDIYYYFIVMKRDSGGLFILETKFLLDSQYLDPDYTLHFNGDDTVIIASSATYPGEGSRGQLMFITRNGATWSENVTMEWILPSQVGFLGDNSLLGNNAFGAVDKDNFFFGAPYEGYYDPSGSKRNAQQEVQNLGKVLLVQRRNALNSDIGENRTWIPIANVDSGVNDYFGSAVVVIGKYVGMTQCLVANQSAYGDFPCQFWVLPQCTVKPIGLSCVDQHFDSCNGINFTQPFYSVNDPLCDSKPKANIVFEGETYNITFSFSRQFVANETCQSILDCIKPPVAPPMTVPVSAPGTSVTPNKPTSGASALCTLLYLLALAFAALF